MIRIPHDEIIKRIKEATSLSEDEIMSKIESKLSQLGGLVSKDGAAHIVANELNVKLVEPTERKKIKDLFTGMRNVELLGKVQTIFEGREFVRTDGSKGKVGSVIVGDETGTIRLVCWGDLADHLPKIEKDNIILITNGHVRDSNRGYKEVHLNSSSKFVVNPPGESIGEVVKRNSIQAKRKAIKDLIENDENVELLGTIVQIFDPRFFEICPECGRRAKGRDDSFFCDVHGEVKPEYSYLMNIFLDDGSDSIRVTFFRNQIEHLTGKNREAMDAYRQMPEKFEEVKTDLLGNIIKIVGKAKNNAFFNRLEFNANLVFPEPDPDEELNKLNKV